MHAVWRPENRTEGWREVACLNLPLLVECEGVEEEGAGVEVNTSIGIFTGVFRHTVPGRLNTGESWQN
jgi:hypothetical protein